jgi:hypothetical protein
MFVEKHDGWITYHSDEDRTGEDAAEETDDPRLV